MPAYLLPCSCGQRLKVSTAQAGQPIRCACGNELTVPTLRGLRELEVDEGPTKARDRSQRTWDNRHRAAFVLIVAALGCFLAAGYFLLQVPVLNEVASDEVVANWLDTGTPADVLAIYNDLKKGLPATEIDMEVLESIRSFFLWCASIAAAAGLAGLIAAGLILRRRPQKRPAMQETST